MGLIVHVGIVLFLLWMGSFFGFKFVSWPVTYFVLFVHLYLIYSNYMLRLRRQIRHEERNYANQKKLLTDLETARWLNYCMKIIWPICMEKIASQDILMPLIPWFLDKFKPWTAKKVKIQELYLGRNPPTITDVRTLNQSSEDDHLILEMGINFLSAEDMSALLAVQMRKRLGGMSTNLHVKSMHIEGKVRVGVKFLREYPFIKRLRVCFEHVPYFQMTVKPIFSHGVDVAELPGVANWMDKLLAIAFEKSLVQPNILVVDVERLLCSSQGPESNSDLQGAWFHIDESSPVGYVNIEIIEAVELKPTDYNGLSDPFVKGYLGLHHFKTKVQKKTLTPKWQEEFKLPISSWETPNVLLLSVRDKDHIRDDVLGNCEISLNDLRGGQRHDIWIPLEHVKTGRLHMAITVEEEKPVGKTQTRDGDPQQPSETKTDTTQEDEIEEVNVNDNNGSVWIFRPGSDASTVWAQRKNKFAKLSTLRTNGNVAFMDSPNYGQNVTTSTKFQGSTKSSVDSESVSGDDNEEDGGKGGKMRSFRNKMHNLRSKIFKHRSSKSFVDPTNEATNLESMAKNREAHKDISPCIPGKDGSGSSTGNASSHESPAGSQNLSKELTSRNFYKDVREGLSGHSSFHGSPDHSQELVKRVIHDSDLAASDHGYQLSQVDVSKEENKSIDVSTSSASVCAEERSVPEAEQTNLSSAIENLKECLPEKNIECEQEVNGAEIRSTP